MRQGELHNSSRVPGHAGPPGFAVPLVVRYVLETAATVAEAVTVFVAPGTRPQVSAQRAATNHRGTVPDRPELVAPLCSVERQEALQALLARDPGPEAVAAAFLSAPLRTTAYDRGFGTMYTAVYRPDLGFVDLRWPGSRWRRDFSSPDATHLALYSAPCGPPA